MNKKKVVIFFDLAIKIYIIIFVIVIYRKDINNNYLQKIILYFSL